MKTLRILFCLIFCLSVVVACAPAAEQTVEPVTEAATEASAPTAVVIEKIITATPEAVTESDRSGGILTFAMDNESDLLDPNLNSMRLSQIVYFSVFDSLVALDPTTKSYVPWLATSWEVSEDGKNYTFNLREDVTFHDGTPFNAEAVKFNFDRHHGPDSLATNARGYYESTEVIDEYTVKINLDAPLASFIDDVSYLYRMVSPAAVEKFGQEDFGRNPVGTGPFRFVEWVAGDHITLEKNTDYNWAPDTAKHQGPAYLDGIVFQFITEAGTRLASLEIEEVQAAMSIPPIELERLLKSEDYAIAIGQVPGVSFHFALNYTKPPLDESAVRQAMNYGIDREAIIQIVFGPLQRYGANRPAYNILTPETFGYTPSAELYHYNPEKAVQLLDEAGWVINEATGLREKDGEILQVILSTWEQQSVADVVQAQLTDIGFDIVLRVLPTLSVNEQQRAGETHGAPLPYARSDPGVLNAMFLSENIGGWNLSFYNEKDMEEMLLKAASESDREAREQMYFDITKRIMEDAVVLPLYYRDNIVAARSYVRQLGFDRGYYPLMYDVWMR